MLSLKSSWPVALKNLSNLLLSKSYPYFAEGDTTCLLPYGLCLANMRTIPTCGFAPSAHLWPLESLSLLPQAWASIPFLDVGDATYAGSSIWSSSFMPLPPLWSSSITLDKGKVMYSATLGSQQTFPTNVSVRPSWLHCGRICWELPNFEQRQGFWLPSGIVNAHIWYSRQRRISIQYTKI